MSYRILRTVTKWFLQALFGALGGVRVEGRANVPTSGGLVVAPNHVSHVDPPLIGVVLPRPAWFVATTDLFRMPVLGRLAAALHAFPIRQDSPDRAALRRTEDILRSGEVVVMFPEGHESVDGRLQPLQGGPVLVAIRSGCPVLPVAIVGSNSMTPPRSWRLRRVRRPVVVRFGRPIPAATLAGGYHGRAALDHGVALLTRAIAELRAEVTGSRTAQGLLPTRLEPLS